MDLVKPPLADVSPGQPVTAQAWNDQLAAIEGLYDFLLSIDRGTVLRVSLTHDGQALTHAVVVASNGTFAVQGVAPLGGTDHYILNGLTAGEWTVRASAPGLATKEQTLTMPTDDILAMALESDGSVEMPSLFGLTAKEAVNELDAAGIELNLVFDIAGNEIARSSLRDKNSAARILYQLPAAKTLLNPKQERANLVISAQIAQTELVAVPDVKGRTLDEATELLKLAGLEIGTVGYFSEQKNPDA
ncbi:MAG: PASTA domain-containing protein [Desulfobacterales bacterium]|nr:MAG: PASTA domain-containing protein [Desulfobacterales bacterium]